MYIETHCHLDYLKELPLEEILLKIKEAQIQKVITIGVDPQNLDGVRELSHKYPHVFYTQGIHPHDSKDLSEVEIEKIRTRASDPKMVAVGEIGLDYHYDNSPREIQRQNFERQLQMAVDANLPVVVHTREADEDTIAILRNFPSINGVIHSFTSTPELAEFVLGQGFFIGFNGIITFKKAENVQNVVKITPTDRILFETDSPFLTPVPHRGKENAPFYLPFVAAKVAELKGVDPEQLKTEVFNNSLRCFPKLKN